MRLDKIVFTGSSNIGKQVAEAAARNLVPCILELGGKSPCIVDESANLNTAVNKILMARFINCGQTCLAVDYVLVHESKKVQFI